jgi:hypothetical protein
LRIERTHHRKIETGFLFDCFDGRLDLAFSHFIEGVGLNPEKTLAS